MQLKMAQPTCGPCTLCCKLLAVPAIDKPKDQWCSHAKPKAGCGVYETRPESCREFNCLWLQGLGGGALALRPDRLHGVMTATTDGENICLHEDPGYRGAARQTLKSSLENWRQAKRGRYVIVLCGDERVFIGERSTFNELKERA